jgi:spoIIIJ-associated protein
MVEDSMEITAPSVDEAIILGLTRMAVTRDDVVIETLDEGSRGFLGLGARQARVRLTRRRSAWWKSLARLSLPRR